MAPIALSGVGFLLVLLRIGINGFDIADDTLGWVLVALAMWRLRPLSRWFVASTAVAGIGAVLSLVDWVVPGGLVRSAEETAIAAAVVLVALGISERAGAAEDAAVRWQGRAIAWLTGGAVMAGAALNRAVDAGYDDLGATAVLAAAVAFLVSIWFVVLQLYLGRRAYLLPELAGVRPTAPR